MVFWILGGDFCLSEAKSFLRVYGFSTRSLAWPILYLIYPCKVFVMLLEEEVWEGGPRFWAGDPQGEGRGGGEGVMWG